jgi:hypothetical protein
MNRYQAVFLLAFAGVTVLGLAHTLLPANRSLSRFGLFVVALLFGSACAAIVIYSFWMIVCLCGLIWATLGSLP